MTYIKVYKSKLKGCESSVQRIKSNVENAKQNFINAGHSLDWQVRNRSNISSSLYSIQTSLDRQTNLLQQMSSFLHQASQEYNQLDREFNSFLDKLKSFANDVLDQAKSIGQSIADGIMNVFGLSINAVLRSVTNLFKKIAGKLPKLFPISLLSRVPSFRNAANFLLDFTPYIGTLKGIQEVFTGRNYVTNEVLSTQERFATFVGTVLSVIPIPGLKHAGKYVTNKIIDGARNIIGKGKGKLTGSLDGLTQAERRVVDDLLNQGKNVETIPTSTRQGVKTADFRINGVKTELKTIQNPNVNTGVTRIKDGFKQGDAVIIDARSAGLSNQQAQEIINRAAGAFPNKQLPGNVEIWTNQGIITFP